MSITIDNTADTALNPPEMLEAREEPTAFERLLNSAMTEDERRMVNLIDLLFDSSWKFGKNGKAMRGELRRMWMSRGLSTPRFYRAFHALTERRMA